MKNDLVNRLRAIIKEELSAVVAENTYTYGGLLDPKEFDPIDPEVHVTGFGTMVRSELRDEIKKRIMSLYKTAEDAAADEAKSYNKYKALRSELSDKAMLQQLINAELEISDQLESLRTKGGRRTVAIPKQI
jgi:hypothetical protein